MTPIWVNLGDGYTWSKKQKSWVLKKNIQPHNSQDHALSDYQWGTKTETNSYASFGRICITKGAVLKCHSLNYCPFHLQEKVLKGIMFLNALFLKESRTLDFWGSDNRQCLAQSSKRWAKDLLMTHWSLNPTCTCFYLYVITRFRLSMLSFNPILNE